MHGLEAHRIPHPHPAFSYFLLSPVRAVSGGQWRHAHTLLRCVLDASQAEGNRIHEEGHLPRTKMSAAQAQGQGEGSHALSHVSPLQPGPGRGCGNSWLEPLISPS